MFFNFECTIGLYNAWLLIIPAWLFDYILGFIKKEGFNRAGDHSWYSGSDKFMAFSSMFMMLIFTVYAIFVSLKVGTIWFYLGLGVSVFGFIGKTIGQLNFYSAPKNEPIRTGIYKISRNPMYFFGSLVMGGAALAARSGILLIVFLFAVIATHFVVLGEEKHLIEEYGESYMEYKGRVARYFLFF